MSPAPSDPRPGTLAYRVLQILATGPRHGFAITCAIQASGPELGREEGALYPVLHALESHGWIESCWTAPQGAARGRHYRLTGRGHRRVAARDAGRRWWPGLRSADPQEAP